MLHISEPSIFVVWCSAFPCGKQKILNFFIILENGALQKSCKTMKCLLMFNKKVFLFSYSSLRYNGYGWFQFKDELVLENPVSLLEI